VLKHIFKNVCPQNVAFYVDDAYIFGQSLAEINNALAQVLKTAEAHSLLFNIEKSQFGVTSTKCLGHVISNGKVSLDPEKCKALASIPQPTTLKQLRSWLAAINFYRIFFPHISITLAPLYEALRGNPKKLIWNEDRIVAFNKMKQVMLTPPLLTLFSSNNTEHLVMTDSSSIGVGGTLFQRQ